MARVRLFASLKEIAGKTTIEIDIDELETVRDVFDRLCTLYPKLAAYRSIVKAAVNEDYVDWDEKISAADEIAFFPPLSGGCL